MKHIKTFEKTWQERQEEEEIKREKDKRKKIELLSDLLTANPLHKTHDFYIFIGRPDFREAKNGMYKKTLEIENMVKITSDIQSIGAMQGLEMRAKFQADSEIYHIWLPKEMKEDISGKGSQSMEPWLVDLINEHKRKGADNHGREIYKKAYDEIYTRETDEEKYNL